MAYFTLRKVALRVGCHLCFHYETPRGSLDVLQHCPTGTCPAPFLQPPSQAAAAPMRACELASQVYCASGPGCVVIWASQMQQQSHATPELASGAWCVA